MRHLPRFLAAAVAVLALGACTSPPLEGARALDAHGNTAGCAVDPSVAPTGPLAEPTTYPLECWASPPVPPSISPSPYPSPSPVEPPPPAPPLDVKGGYYLAGNANMTADANTIGFVEGFTQYRSLGSRLVIPGYAPNYGYLSAWVNAGKVGNFVTELVCFQTADCVAKSFTVEGVAYTVPAGNSDRNHGNCGGRTQQASLGYGQLSSGALDGYLHTLLVETRALTGPLIVHLYSEVDTDAECGTLEGGVLYTRAESNTRAAAAAAYAIDWLRDPPGDIAPVGGHVRFTVGMGGFHAASYNEVYTEAVRERVDLYNVNTYWRSASSSWLAELNVDLANVRKPGWPVKPVLITEWGTPVTAATGTWTNSQADRIETFARAVWDVNNAADGDSDIEAAFYFNSNTTWATLSPKADGLAALKRTFNDTLLSRQGE